MGMRSEGSDVSQYTDFTSPMTNEYGNHFPRPDIARRRTPEDTSRAVNGNGNSQDEYAVASPMSLASPANGAKRTASGHVKNAPSLPNTPLTATFTGGHSRSRTDSISSTSSRAGELAANLKARLGYAMHKVQNGWEDKDISEVERLERARMNRHSMSHMDQLRRPESAIMGGGYANGFDGTRSPPPKRHSGIYSSMAPVSSSQPTMSSSAAVPRLQPAADIRPGSSHHHFNHSHSHAQQQRRHYATAPSSQSHTFMSPPRTPNQHPHAHSRRPPTLRTDTQTAEAERDALQALFQLGSPHASQESARHFASQASSSQASPLRSEFAATPRRVTFARSESGSSAGMQGRESDENSSGGGRGA